MGLHDIGYKIGAYEQLRGRVEDMKASLSDLNKQLDAAEADVISALLDIREQTGAENMRIEYEGRNYSVTAKCYYSIPKDKRDAAFEQMRNLGMGDLIQERVDDRTLTKELEAVAEANDGLLPDEYGDLADNLSTYTKNTLRRVKA